MSESLPLYEWEYKIIHTRPFNIEKTLNKLGKQGWEVISLTRDRQGVTDYEVCLKRPKIFGISVGKS